MRITATRRTPRIVVPVALFVAAALAAGCEGGAETAAGPEPEVRGGPPPEQAPAHAPVPEGAAELRLGGERQGEAKPPFAPGAPGQAGDGRNWELMERERTIKQQQDAWVAKSLVEQGRRQMQENQVLQAWRNFRAAAELDPGNEEAARLRAEAGAILGFSRDKVDDTVGKVIEDHRVKVDQARAEVFHLMNEGKVLYQKGDYAEAIRRFEGVLEIVRWMPYPVDLTGYQQQAKLYIQSSKDKLRRQEERTAKQRERIARKLAEIEERRRQDQLTERIRNLFVKSNLEFEKENYAEVEALAGQILALDPDNLAAWRLQNVAQDLRHQAQDVATLGNYREQWRKTFEEIDLATVPQVDVVRFLSPEAWSEVRRRAERVAGGSGPVVQKSIEEQRIEAQLDGVAVSPDFTDAPLKAVVQFFRDVSGVNIIISPKVFAETPEEQLRVNLTVQDVSMRDALNLILGMNKLAHRVKDGVLVITTQAEAQESPMLRVFDIRDLLAVPKDFPGTTIRLEATDSGAAGAIPGLGGGGDEKPAITADDLVNLIKGTIAQETWDTPPNSIEPKGGKLIVKNQPKVIAEVEKLMSSLRASHGMLVTIETRFITVEDNFLEDVGIDLRGLGNQLPIGSPSNPGRGGLFLGSPGEPLDDVAFGSPAAPTGAGTSQTSGIFYNDNSDGDMRARVENLFDVALGDPAVMTNSGGLSIQGVYLDDTQVEAILRAVRKTERVNLVTAPKLTCYNTQRANVHMLNQLAYIRDFDVEVAQAATIGDPIVGRIEEGVVLDVKPIVSSDRRYVTLELRPTVAELVRPIPTFSTLLGVANSTPVFIHTPELRIKRAQTTVTVPDRGTVLIGGMKVTREEDVKSGVPFFENIPILSFIFGRKGRGHNRKTLLILVRAEVTLLEEEEADQTQRGGMK
ncbi:MAG: hypothetical protein L0216_04005 [Planctomycetales bacterium]|nr:hypothetical protein [Planctomycetales bacterium]